LWDVFEDIGSFLVTTITASLAKAIETAVAQTKSLMMAQFELASAFNQTSDSAYEIAMNLEYLSGEALPLVSQEVFRASEYFDSYTNMMAGLKISSMIASTGIADFTTVLRNLGAASVGALSPILAKFFGRIIGVSLTDASGKFITFGELITRLNDKYVELSETIQATPWWIFTQLKLQTEGLLRNLVSMPLGELAGGFRLLVDILFDINTQMSLASDKISDINKISIISPTIQGTSTIRFTKDLGLIKTKIDELKEAEDKGFDTTKIKELNDELLKLTDLSGTELKDNFGKIQDKSKLTSDDWIKIRNAMEESNKSAKELFGIMTKSAEESTAKINTLVTALVALSPL